MVERVRGRWPAIGLLLAALLAGCGDGGQGVVSIPAASDRPSPSAAAGAATGANHVVPPAHATPRPTSPVPQQSGRPAAARDPDVGAVGDLARGLLRPDPYTGLAVELDVAGAAAPDGAIRSYLLNVIHQQTLKPVTESGSHSFAGKGNGCWTMSDITAMTSREARTHTSGSTAAVRFFFLDGTFCPSTNFLGMAYEPGSMVIFTAQVSSLATPTVPADAFMKSVTTHEFGHILGLVNLVYKSARNHEDAQHPGHSSNKQSVMYYAIEQSDLIQQFISGPPTTFDSDDEADLQGLRDGTY